MKAAFMTRALRPPVTGIGKYTLNLAHNLADVLDQRFLVFAMQGGHGLERLKDNCIYAPFATDTGARRLLWEQTIVPIEVVSRGIDLYHSPNHVLPVALTCASVVTVHDLSFRRRDMFNLPTYLYLNVLTRVAISRSSRIIADSHYTEQEIARQFPSASSKTRVVYLGLDPRFSTPPDRESADRFARERGLGPYVLFAGNVEPRKNLPRLLQAFEIAVREAELPHELVICGPLAWRYQPILSAWRDSPLRDRVRFAGYVPDAEMPLWYAAADALAFPSLAEGFGLPALEAMASGTPVIASNCTALPEVVGDAAVTVHPGSVRSIADGLIKVLSSSGLRAEMSERGRTRSQLFSWGTAARETVSVYEEALSC